MINPKVSVVIISFNQEEFIAKAILGALNQEYENLEVVVSDDGSTDKTRQIIEALGSKYPLRLITILNKENVGITKNCNRALRECTGEYITFIGGDDVMLQGKISAQISWFQSGSNRVMCGHPVECILSDGSRSPNQEYTNPNNYGEGPLNYLKRNKMLHGTSIMVKRAAIPKYGFDERITVASDFKFWVDVLIGGGEYGTVQGVFAQRRIHANNITRNQEKIFQDYELSYYLIGRQYPEYKKMCINLTAQHVYYYQGVAQLKLGNMENSRKFLLKSFKLRPFYFKAWLRFVQTLMGIRC